MTGPVDRDRQVENLLRQSMPSGAPALSLCIDAERLAAWSAGALRREDAAAVERHLADCAHCQAMLAAFVDSEPPATGAVSVWQRWSIRWLVPAAAASAAVLVWVLATREPAEPPAASTTMARVEEAPSMPPTSPGVAERQQAMPPASPTAQRSADEAAAAARPFAPAGEPPEEGAGGRARSEMTADARSNVPAGSVAQSANAARSAERSSASPSPPSSPATGVGPAASAPFAQRESVEFDAAAKAGPATLGAQALVPALARAGSAAVVFAADSTLAPMWRIQPDGRVEGSSDRGQTWSQVALGPAPRVAAGSAPTADVCWLVGAEGVVWRSTDGATFVRRPFVEATALVTVVAQDATRATVTTADGRAFTTTDGGGSWRLGP